MLTFKMKVAPCLCLASSLALVGGVNAQDATGPTSEFDDKLTAIENRLKALDTVSLAALPSGLSPGLSGLVPTAYGLAPGTAAIGIGYQERIRYNDDLDDGAIGGAIGFGKPGAATGFNLGVNVLSLFGRTTGGSFGDRGSLDFKVHHKLSQESQVAVGVENFFNWGVSDSTTSLYAVYSQAYAKSGSSGAFSRFVFNGGIGSGRFRSEKDDANDKSTVNVFGSVTTNLSTNINAFAEWTGQDADVGLSIVPFKKIPLVITPAVVDITKSAGTRPRFVIGAAYAFNY